MFFEKRVMFTQFGIHVFIGCPIFRLGEYLMKVISEADRGHYIKYLHFYWDKYVYKIYCDPDIKGAGQPVE